MLKFNLSEMQAIYKSFDEPYSDFFYEEWKKIFKNIKRVHGIVGMANSGKVACEMADEEYFVLIDGDSYPLPHNINNAILELPYGHTWYKFQSIQGVTHTITPHGALAIFNKYKGIELCTNAIKGSVHCNFQPGFIVIDTIPLSIEFCNQSASIAFKAAYKDCCLFLQDGLNPVTYLPKQNIKYLKGKRQRIIPWLSKGSAEPYGLYALYGAHKAVYDVFSENSAHLNTNNIEMFKMINHDIPIIDTYDELLDIIKPFYKELEIDIVFPINNCNVTSIDPIERYIQLQKLFDRGKHYELC